MGRSVPADRSRKGSLPPPWGEGAGTLEERPRPVKAQ